MSDTRKTFDEIFGEEESALERRARIRRETEKAARETPEGKAQALRDEEARAKRGDEFDRLEAEQAAADGDEDDDTDDDDDGFDGDEDDDQ